MLVAAGLVTLALAVRQVHKLKAELREVEAKAGQVADELAALPPEMDPALGSGARHVISVEILNLFELAHKESVFTRPLTALTPRLLRDVVHRRIIARVRESLDDQGVRADVRLHRAP